MENFTQISIILAEHEGIGLNLDILETGLLNIIALIGILVYTGKDFLGSILQERKDSIVKSVQDAEDRLSEANKRLSEAQKQLSQAHVVISEIRNETVTAKTNLLKSDASLTKKELTTRFNRAVAAFRSKERIIFLEYKQLIVYCIVKRTAIKVNQIFSSKTRARTFIDETIQKLEGDLL